MAGNFSTEPIDGIEREPIGGDPFTIPVFRFSPTEPETGVLTRESGLPFQRELGGFIARES